MGFAIRLKMSAQSGLAPLHCVLMPDQAARPAKIKRSSYSFYKCADAEIRKPKFVKTRSHEYIVIR
jgi:hypothetical protein